MKQFDWNRRQRQPLSGLAVIFVNTFWEVLKRAWPFLILPLINADPEKPDRYEIITLIFLAVTIIIGVLKFFFFTFHLEGDQLIIRRGWWKKEVKSIPLEKIQTVHIEQGPIHQLLNVVKFSIDTAGSQKTEAVIDALKRPMAEALKERLLAARGQDIEEGKEIQKAPPLLQLSDRDLLKLSISANHIETLFLIIIFIVGVIDNLGEVGESTFTGIRRFFPGSSLYGVLLIGFAVLLLTILVSTGRIFFSFYDFSIYRLKTGFQIRSGLFHVKERLVGYSKIQYLTIRANWIRKKMRLWMLQYFVAGSDTTGKNTRVQVPITRSGFTPLLLGVYHEIPQQLPQPVTIHPVYVWRRLLISLFATLVVLVIPLWFVWQAGALYFLVIPAYTGIVAALRQKKYKLFPHQEIVYISSGTFGEEKTLMKWYKLQSIRIKQSIFQRRRGLATLQFHTAGGVIRVPFIRLDEARGLADYALMKAEGSREGWN